jgi:hypothetical protein
MPLKRSIWRSNREGNIDELLCYIADSIIFNICQYLGMEGSVRVPMRQKKYANMCHRNTIDKTVHLGEFVGSIGVTLPASCEQIYPYGSIRTMGMPLSLSIRHSRDVAPTASTNACTRDNRSEWMGLCLLCTAVGVAHWNLCRI